MPQGVDLHGECLREGQDVYQVCLHKHHQGLGFWIAEARVMLQDHRAAFGQHDIGVEDAGEVYTLCFQRLQGCGNNVAKYLLFV